jgi:hypothetical protein
MDVPTAAMAPKTAPTVPPTAPPTPAPSAALVPSSVSRPDLSEKYFFRVASDMTRLTSSFPYPRPVNEPYACSALLRSRNNPVTMRSLLPVRSVFSII